MEEQDITQELQEEINDERFIQYMENDDYWTDDPFYYDDDE